MPDLILILGPSAVGKTTIGKHVSNKWDYKLLHSQAEFELVLNLFPYNSKDFNILTNKIKRLILNYVSRSNLKGLVFTTSVDFSKPYINYINVLIDSFVINGGKTYVIELYADTTTRLNRNKNLNRALIKPRKFNTKESEKILLKMDQTMKLNSMGGKKII